MGALSGLLVAVGYVVGAIFYAWLAYAVIAGCAIGARGAMRLYWDRRAQAESAEVGRRLSRAAGRSSPDRRRRAA